MVVNATGLDLPGIVETMELVDLTGKILVDLPVKPVPSEHGLYNVTSFVPPEMYFYVKVGHLILQCIIVNESQRNTTRRRAGSIE